MTENPEPQPTPPSSGQPAVPPPAHQSPAPPSGAPEPPYIAQGQQPYQQPYAPATTQPMSPADEKLWATLVHLSPFVAAMIGLPFLGPLIVYLVLKDRGPFIRFHAAQALNFQLIVLIGLLVSIPLIFALGLGFLMMIAIAIAAVILQIVAAVQANNGQWYRYPMTPDWVK